MSLKSFLKKLVGKKEEVVEQAKEIVSDVKEAVETIKIWSFYKKQSLDTTFIPKLASKQL